MGYWVLIAVAVGVALVLGFQRFAKRTFVAGRTPAPLEEIYSPVKDQVSFEVFTDVWNTLGRAYAVDPRLLRPDDAFLALQKMDSWTLGKGEDDLGKWLTRRGLGTPPQLQTLIEFARWAQSSTATTTGAAT